MLSAIKELVFGKPVPIWGRSYKNLLIKSDYRVHEVAFDLVQERLGSGKSLRALDIATGTGAFAQRVVDRFPGWSVEVNDFEKQAMVNGFKRHSVDLNSQFRDSFAPGGYDLVVALEILEHLENPWNFLREVRKLLRDGGVLLLSTPNVDSILDRLIYLRDGHPVYFGERGYVNSGGHTTQVPDWLFRKIADASGYSHVELSGAVDTAPLIGPKGALQLALLRLFFRRCMRNANSRSINVYFCQ
jgi:SAM-dependent methyltransferase